MERKVGTVSMGLRAPIVKEGDDLQQILIDTVLEAEKAGEFTIRNRDILAVTESILARAQANYASIDDIASDIRAKMGAGTLGVVFPILSRNRFALCLRGIARAAGKVVLMLSYPADEVGNHLIDIGLLDEKGVNPYSDVFTQEQFEDLFGKSRHAFTGMDYINYYRGIIEEEGAEAEIMLANDPKAILAYTKNILVCDIHTRKRTKRILTGAGARVLGLDDILTQSVGGSGYNEEYGLLGSNRSSEDRIKLFPVHCQEFVEGVKEKISALTGKHIEVMIYGDGAFKDPAGKIWELADPVVSPGYTKGLEGTSNEIKLKYLADNDFADLRGEELQKAISDYIKNKKDKPEDPMATEGTTPRRLTDLIGSLCDLTSGSGDKGTPFIYIQGYFDSYIK